MGVPESMKTPVPALVLTLIFLCQGWGRHFLLSNKDSNLTDIQFNEDYSVECWSDNDCPSSRRCMSQKEFKRYMRREFGKRVGRKKRAVNGIKGAKKCYNLPRKPKSEGSCFGPTNTIETKEGIKTLCELRIGDLIRTSSGDHHTDFTEFLGWLDRQRSSPAEMLQIFTSDNYPAVTLSGSHLVLTANTTKYAGDLVPGDTLLHRDGEQVKEQEISMIKTSMETGYWAPLTRSGTLLVNGYLMSCYASYPHTVSDIAMGPVKAMPMILLD